MRRVFFSRPATTRSIASMKSAITTLSRSLRAARSADSLTTLARSAPANPGVRPDALGRGGFRCSHTVPPRTLTTVGDGSDGVHDPLPLGPQPRDAQFHDVAHLQEPRRLH